MNLDKRKDIRALQSDTHLELFLQLVDVLLARLDPLIGQIQVRLLVFLLVLNVSQLVRDLTVLITLRRQEHNTPCGQQVVCRLIKTNLYAESCHPPLLRVPSPDSSSSLSV